MGSTTIKQRENIRKESGGNSFGDDEAYCHPISKSRTQELEERRKAKQYAGLDNDLKMIMNKTGYSIKGTYEHLPSGDVQTVSSNDLKQEKEYRNRKSRVSHYRLF